MFVFFVDCQGAAGLKGEEGPHGPAGAIVSAL